MVSIVIPVFNGEKTIKKTIDSLLCQTYSDVEIIVVNDGSKDGTQAILEGYGSKIRVINKPNGGVSSARNCGIAAAMGEYLMFVDGDDLCEPFMVERILQKQVTEQVDFVIATVTDCCRGVNTVQTVSSVVVRGRDKIREMIAELVENNLNAPFSKLYLTRILIEKQIRFDEKLPLGEDLNFNLEYLLSVDSVAFLDEPLYVYMMDNSTAVGAYREDYYQRRILALQKMNETFQRNMLDNPFHGILMTKIVYATAFNLQKEKCPHNFRKKIELLEIVRKKYCQDYKKSGGYHLQGVYGVLSKLLLTVPSALLYPTAKVIHAGMQRLPKQFRGVSV